MYYAEVNKTFKLQMDTLASLAPILVLHSEDEPDFVQSAITKINKTNVGKNAVDFSEDMKDLE
jgi:hypothetical protein